MPASLVHLRSGIVAPVVALALGASPAVAEGGLSVHPTQLKFTKKVRAGALTLRNDDAQPRRYEVSVMAWAEVPDGHMRLEPSSELLVFPSLFVLAPGEERLLRVATAAEPEGPERPYRVFVEELPPEPSAAASEGAVRVRTRVGLPVFVAATEGAAELVLATVGAAKGTVGFSIENQGTAHVRVESVGLVARDEAGRSLLELSWPGWYVLAGGRRDYSTPLSAAICGQVRTIEVLAKPQEEGAVKPAKATLNLLAGACRH